MYTQHLFLPHPLASVRGSYNAIYVKGIIDDVMLYGRGAGSFTGSSVVSDIMSG